MTLEQEGYLHASREDQWEGVRDRYYTDVTEPLLLLEIDTDLLDVPWVEELPAPARHRDVPAHLRTAQPAAVVATLVGRVELTRPATLVGAAQPARVIASPPPCPIAAG